MRNARMWEADALLDAIFDHPDDDTPRLVYADWLQEHGQENYAEFIRLQCAAARCKVWSDEANELWVKIGRVWNRLADEWWLDTFERTPWDATDFERGFLRWTPETGVEEIEAFEACRCWFPPSTIILQSVSDLAYLADMPISRRFRGIGLAWHAEHNTTPERIVQSVVPFVRSPNLCKLRVLNLSHISLRREILEALLHKDALPALEEILVAFSEWSDCVPAEALQQLQGRYKRVIRG